MRDLHFRVVVFLGLECESKPLRNKNPPKYEPGVELMF